MRRGRRSSRFAWGIGATGTTRKLLIELRDALEDGDRVITVKLPSGHTETARASEIIRKLGLARIRRQLLHLFRREQLHHLVVPEEVPHRRVHLSRPRRDAVVRALRHGTFADGSGGRPAHHHAHFGVRPIPDSAARSETALLVWTTTPWTLTSNVAVAVNPEMTYLKVKHGDWFYYVAKGNFEHDRVQDLQVEGKHETHKLPSIRTILKGSGGRRSGRRVAGQRTARA